MTTLRQAEANRRNARRSTGPKTDGKDASRRNRLDHGLTARVVLPDAEEQAVAVALPAWRDQLAPVGPVEHELVEQLVQLSVLRRKLPALRDARRGYEADRATSCWDADRMAAAEDRGRRLARRPGALSSELAGSVQGCDWLIDRWSDLGRILDESGTWDDAQRSLALDLLGRPHELRAGTTAVDGVDEAQARERRRAVVEAELEALRAARPALAEADDVEHWYAAQGHAAEWGPELRRLRRYEVDIQRRWGRAWDRLQAAQRLRTERAAAASSPTLTPTLSPASASEEWEDRQFRELLRSAEQLLEETGFRWPPGASPSPEVLDLSAGRAPGSMSTDPAEAPTSTLGTGSLTSAAADPETIASGSAAPPDRPRNRRARRALELEERAAARQAERQRQAAEEATRAQVARALA